MVHLPTFVRLNKDWGGEPNAPAPEVSAEGKDVLLRFYLNPWAYKAHQWQAGTLFFRDCQAWRLGPTNDEGWYLGQCRYGRTAPQWGEFYELIGDDDLRWQPGDWMSTIPRGSGERHFLFYLRDETFECLSSDWSYESGRD